MIRRITEENVSQIINLCESLNDMEIVIIASDDHKKRQLADRIRAMMIWSAERVTSEQAKFSNGSCISFYTQRHIQFLWGTDRGIRPDFFIVDEQISDDMCQCLAEKERLGWITEYTLRDLQLANRMPSFSSVTVGTPYRDDDDYNTSGFDIYLNQLLEVC